jgi:hypothetical protein
MPQRELLHEYVWVADTKADHVVENAYPRATGYVSISAVWLWGIQVGRAEVDGGGGCASRTR